MADDPTQLASDLRHRISRAVDDVALDTGLSEHDEDLIVVPRDTLIDTILAAIDDEAIDRMAQQYVDDTHIRALEFRNGAEMSLKPAQDMVAMWVAAARTMLGDAENYTETEVGLPAATWSMDVKLAGEVEMFTLTVQRARKPTPHELRRQAQAEHDQARAELEEMRNGLDGYRIGSYATPAWGGAISRVEVEHLSCGATLDDGTDAVEYDAAALLSLIASHRCDADAPEAGRA